MFGVDDNQQQTSNDPAMLDNVKQIASQPAHQVAPATNTANPAAQAQAPAADGLTPFGPAPTVPTVPAAPPQPQPQPQAHAPAPTPYDPSVPPTQQMNPPAAPVSLNEAPAAPAEPAIGFSSTPPPAHVPAAPAPRPPAPAESDATTPPPDPTAPAPVGAPSSPPSVETSSSEISSVSSPAASSSPKPALEPSGPADKDHLAGLKEDALTHLEKVSASLDGTPTETFKNTMMMIQANDNHHLLQKALDSAKNIEDDKERAQALLDIINEINYFASEDKR